MLSLPTNEDDELQVMCCGGSGDGLRLILDLSLHIVGATLKQRV